MDFDIRDFMNKMIAVIHFLSGIIFLSFVTPNDSNQVIDEIVQSIQTGSSRELSKFFTNTIALSMDENSGDYSKNQSELIFRDFFRRFPPEDFKVVHQRESHDNAWYIIGNYLSKEADFTVLVKGKSENGSSNIYSMDIRRE